jgi:hypothetical protein
VILLAIEGTLLFELAEVFSPARVQQLTTDPEEMWLLPVLAGEPDEVIEQRKRADAKKKRLQEAMNMFRKRLGDSMYNRIKMKATSSPHQTPPPQVPVSGGLLPNTGLGTGQQAKRRSNRSITNPSSPSSNASATTDSSENTALTVPSQGRPPKIVGVARG